MKKIICLSTLVMLFTWLGVQAQTSGKKALVVYYSHSGNTRAVAELIRDNTGAELFAIEPVNDYPSDHKAHTEQAKKEIEAGYKPALKNEMANLEPYDVIFVGSPCWWATIAPPVASFLAGYDLSGKTIVPFMTHEGSGMGRSEADLRALCPSATVLKGLPIRGSAAKSAGAEVAKWLKANEAARSR